MGGSSKAPPPTPEELALEKRTQMGLTRERAKTERMLKAQSRGSLGAKSLLGGLKKETYAKQEDVVHSDAMSSEERVKLHMTRLGRQTLKGML